MEPRLKLREVNPEGFKAFLTLGRYLNTSGLEPSLLDLVRLRASQINGCAYCIDAHTKDARANGETEQRLYTLSAWHLSPFYSERERAALAWTEALTLIGENDVPDDLYEMISQQFTEKELLDVTLAVIDINGWDRMAKTFRLVPGTYQPQLANRVSTQAS
jgi:AhpD family alkylhydroperoxidase